MNNKLLISPSSQEWLDEDNAHVAGYFEGLGFYKLWELLPMRVFDLLNLNRIDAIKAEEILVSLYRFLRPENRELDQELECGFVEAAFDYQKWSRQYKCQDVTVCDLIFYDGMYLKAFSRLFSRIKKAFWKSDEYNWREYRFANRKEYLQSIEIYSGKRAQRSEKEYGNETDAQ